MSQSKSRTGRHSGPLAEGDRPRVCYVVTHSMTSRFLRGQLRYMRGRGYEVTLISSPGADLSHLQDAEGVQILCVPMERTIRPFRDLCALARLFWAFWKIRPHVVNAGSPKAGLLALLAALAAHVPVRIYTLRGLRLETTKGLTRRILAATERVASACAHRVIAVSHSLAHEYRSLGLAPQSKITVLAAGSSNGVNAGAFEPTPFRRTQALQLAGQLGIQPGEPVIGYVGRLTRDKGTADLVEAFLRVTGSFPNVRLLLVGGLEKEDALDESTVDLIRTHSRIICTGFVDSVAPYYHTMSVLAFPSYREGFPNAVLEAQASGLPVVGYRATGVVDAVSDGSTGRLVSVGAVGELAEALVEYIRRPALAAKHGACGRNRVQRDFSNERVWSALAAEYRRLLKGARLDIVPSHLSPQEQTRAA